MKEKDIEIKIVDAWAADEIVELYKAGGWWKDHYDKSKIKFLINGSFAFAVSVHKNKAVGMGRLLSDGVSDAYIQDIVVLPKFREKGIGKEIVKTLVDHCKSKGISWIGLIAEPGQSSFYSNLGFQPMKNYTPMKNKED